MYEGEEAERAEVKVTIKETRESFDDYRVTPMTIDNHAKTTIRRKITNTEEWAQSYVIEREKARTSGHKIDFSAGGLGIAANMDEALKSRYSVSEETKRTYTDQVDIEVPPLTRVQVDFIYRLVWQHGIMKMITERDGEIEVPFRVAIRLDRNIVQHDEVAD
jgi:hypothetical protein